MMLSTLGSSSARNLCRSQSLQQTVAAMHDHLELLLVDKDDLLREHGFGHQIFFLFRRWCRSTMLFLTKLSAWIRSSAPRSCSLKRRPEASIDGENSRPHNHDVVLSYHSF